MNLLGPPTDTGGVQFWHNPECQGWLDKQGATPALPHVQTRTVREGARPGHARACAGAAM